jgi:phosphatidylserine/phosphatidylglycerophosphate/cardiolipin synthase-like enzyme
MRVAAAASFLAALLFAACTNQPQPYSYTPPLGPAPEEETAPDATDAGAADTSSPDPKGNTHCNATDPRTVPADVAIFPDEGEAPYVTTLQKAKKKIDVMIYLMGFGGVLDTLKAKAQAGVKVRVIMDQGSKGINQKYADQLTAAGAQTAWSDPVFPYMHAKVLMVDDEEAVISSGNYLKSNVQNERNFAAVVRDPEDIASFSALFDADWNKTTPDLKCTRLVVAPTNSKQRILDVINSAKKSLVIESMQFADYDVRGAVVARKKAGVDVRVLLAAPSWVDANQAAGDYLKQNQVPARWLSNPMLHVKAIVADGALAYIGSENLSSTSLTKNREVGIVLTAVEKPGVDSIASTFEKDWGAATAF